MTETTNASLRRYLATHFTHFPDQDWELLNILITPQTYKKGEIILPIGRPCYHLWFIEKGAVKSHEISPEGREIVTHFFTENNFFIDLKSVITRTVSDVEYTATEDCELKCMPYFKLAELFDKLPRLERVGRMLLERQLLLEYDLRKLHLNYNALERYAFLMERQPEIFQRFALKDIASFIGVTPESLSRIRKMK